MTIETEVKPWLRCTCCVPSCLTVRVASNRPPNTAQWTKAELHAELLLLGRERILIRDEAIKARRALGTIPRWVRWMFASTFVRWVLRKIGRRV